MDIKDILKQVQIISNANEGFGALIIFILTLIFGWVTGIFNAIVKKPKLKVRFMEKMTFYSFFGTGESFHHEQLNEKFDYHKTAFAVYMSIANIGNAPTSIDKIYLGYTKNTPNTKIFNKTEWLAQWHTLTEFRIKLNLGEENNDKSLFIPSLKLRNDKSNSDDFLEVGKYVSGVAYFEQAAAWGSLNPKPINNKEDVKITIKIIDIYGRKYFFKTVLKKIPIEKAIEYNPNFGMIEDFLRENPHTKDSSDFT